MRLARLVCRWRGHKLPREIGAGHPAITITQRQGPHSAGGVARPIACERCGHSVGPMDDGYPMIVP